MCVVVLASMFSMGMSHSSRARTVAGVLLCIVNLQVNLRVADFKIHTSPTKVEAGVIA